MARVAFTEHVAKVAPGAGGVYAGADLREVLDDVFRAHPQLRHYLLDDQGRVRKHVAVFIDGVRVPGAKALECRMTDASDVYVMQALSGG
ncbi:MAG: MoaD/ThiS family protein [Caulobacterales bacterium]